MPRGPRRLTASTASRVFAGALAVSFFILFAAAGASAGHLDGGASVSEVTVHTYADPPAEQRRPGATDRSYWTESISSGLPAGEPVYLTRTVTYRPIPSDCAPSDTETFGVDRNNTYEGERRIDDSATESVKSFEQDTDARGRYEREYGDAGALTTTDWAYVERLEIEWYERDDFGAPLRIARGDRFVSAQRDCLDNPDVAGWYRTASVTEGEYENGTAVRQSSPTFSHWIYICECASREAAVDTLGPPPSRTSSTRTTATPTADGAATTPRRTRTPASGAGRGTPVDRTTAEGMGRPATQTARATPTSTAADSPAATDKPPRSTSPAAGGPARSTPGWDDRVLRTPTAADGAGVTPLAVPVAILAAVGLLARR